MEILRTPEERFVGLPDFDFEPRYAHVALPDGADGSGADNPHGSLRVAYLDEGPTDAAPVLLMHGEPSWSFLYRTMIPVLVERGHRVIAPDLVGFGRSDKPSAPADYTYARHVAWMEELLVGRLDLRRIQLDSPHVRLVVRDGALVNGPSLPASEDDSPAELPFRYVTITNGVVRVVGDLPVADRILHDTFWVGVWPGLDTAQLDHIARHIRCFLGVDL